VEYNFLGLDDRTFIAPFGFQRLAGDTFFVRNRDIQMVKVGINYRFKLERLRLLIGEASRESRRRS
jgi:hypothetical protein